MEQDRFGVINGCFGVFAGLFSAFVQAAFVALTHMWQGALGTSLRWAKGLGLLLKGSAVPCAAGDGAKPI